MNALVTGAAGYLGAAIVEALSELDVPVAATLRSHHPTARSFQLPQCTEVVADLERLDATVDMIHSQRPEVVFHCASAFPAGIDPDAAEQVDRRMLDNLLAAGTYTLLVIASTEMTRPGYAETAFQRAYAASKRHLERRAVDHYQTTGTPVQIVRYPHLAGTSLHARDRRQGRLLSKLIRSACGLLADPIRLSAPPHHLMRFAHVREAASATVELAQACRLNQALSICHLPAISAAVTLADLVGHVTATIGSPPAVLWPDGRTSSGDCAPSLHPGLAEMIGDMAFETTSGGNPQCLSSSILPSTP